MSIHDSRYHFYCSQITRLNQFNNEFCETSKASRVIKLDFQVLNLIKHMYAIIDNDANIFYDSHVTAFIVCQLTLQCRCLSLQVNQIVLQWCEHRYIKPSTLDILVYSSSRPHDFSLEFEKTFCRVQQLENVDVKFTM